MEKGIVIRYNWEKVIDVIMNMYKSIKSCVMDSIQMHL